MRRPLSLALALTLTLVPAALARADDDPATQRARARNERAAIGVLKVFLTAQSLFREGDKEGDGILDYAANLKELVDTELVSKDLAGGEKAGYVFVVKHSTSTPEFLWAATASPKEPGKTGDRYFATNHTGVVYQSTKPFAIDDKCDLDGCTPVGQALPGIDAMRGRSPLARALAKAAEQGVRVGDLLLRAPDGARWAAFELRGRGETGWRVDEIHLETKTKAARLFGARLDAGGALEEMKLATGTLGTREPQSEEKGELDESGKAIVLRGGAKERKGVWAEDMLPRGLALVILPRLALAGELKLPLRFPLLEDAFAAAQPTFELTQLEPAPKREGAGEGERAFGLSDGKRKAVVWVDAKGELQALRDFDESLLVRASEEVFEAEVLGKQAAGNLREARKQGNEAAAIGALKTISTAQALFREGDKDGNGVLDYAGGLEDLGKTQLIDAVLASGEKNGYRFAVCSGAKAPEFLWMAVASPKDAGAGGRHFAVNQAGVIYSSDKPFELDGVECAIKGGQPVGR